MSVDLANIQSFQAEICYYRAIAMTYPDIVAKLRFEHDVETDLYTLRQAVTIWDSTLSVIEEDNFSTPTQKSMMTRDTYNNLAAQTSLFFSSVPLATSGGLYDFANEKASKDHHRAQISPNWKIFSCVPPTSGCRNLSEQLHGSRHDVGDTTNRTVVSRRHWCEDSRILAPTPPTSADWIAARRDLSCYYKKRWNVLNVERKCGEIGQTLLKKIHSARANAGDQRDLETLYNVWETETSCRNLLSNTRFESILIQKIQHLITIPEVKHESLPGELYHGLESRVIQMRRLPVYTPLTRSSAPNSDLATSKSLSEYDAHLSDFANSHLLDKINLRRFQSNMRSFLGATERRLAYQSKEGVQKALIRASSINPLERLYDDLWHSHKLFKLLKSTVQHDLVAIDKLEQIWVLIIAIVAICYGCMADPAFLLSTLDILLDKLRSALGKPLQHDLDNANSSQDYHHPTMPI